MTAAVHPTKIMIIRHGEKPPKKGGPPFDIQEDGSPGNGKSLIVQGWQRAGALNNFFAPYKLSPSTAGIATPDYIYAASPSNESQRPCETVTPLAAWLKYAQGSPQFNVSFTIGGGEKKMVESMLALSGNVLICWEHDHIMPDIMSHINKHVTISNYSSITPNPFPDVFYLVWILDLVTGKDGKQSYTWSYANQNLIAGDVQS